MKHIKATHLQQSRRAVDVICRSGMVASFSTKNEEESTDILFRAKRLLHEHRNYARTFEGATRLINEAKLEIAILAAERQAETVEA